MMLPWDALTQKEQLRDYQPQRINDHVMKETVEFKNKSVCVVSRRGGTY
jgi:hypothetical protein